MLIFLTNPISFAVRRMKELLKKLIQIIEYQGSSFQNLETFKIQNYLFKIPNKQTQSIHLIKKNCLILWLKKLALIQMQEKG